MEINHLPFSELLSEIVDNRGKTCPTTNFGIPLIATNCVKNQSIYPSYEKVRYVSQEIYDTWFRGHPKPGDLIFVTKGSPGQVCMVPEPIDFCIAQDMVAIRADNKKVYPKYLFAMLRSNEVQSLIENMHVGTLIPHFKKGDFDKLLLPVPDRKTQESIGDYYFDFSAKIELNRRMNATLEAMARAVFRQWFVENEEVGDWEVGILGDVIKVNERSISKYHPHNEIEYIDISSVTTGHLEGTTPYSLIDAPSRARRLVNHGDTIWSTVRPNRRSYLFISNPKENLVVSTGFAVLTPIEISPSFIYFWVTTDEFVDYLVSNADGSAYPAVLPERFAEAEIHLPPKAMLESFENLAGSMLARIEQNEIESRTLASLRDSLLPKLMRGEVCVKDVEKEL
jgi:type I restriction enzyme S subunit